MHIIASWTWLHIHHVCNGNYLGILWSIHQLVPFWQYFLAFPGTNLFLKLWAWEPLTVSLTLFFFFFFLIHSILIYFYNFRASQLFPVPNLSLKWLWKRAYAFISFVLCPSQFFFPGWSLSELILFSSSFWSQQRDSKEGRSFSVFVHGGLTALLWRVPVTGLTNMTISQSCNLH